MLALDRSHPAGVVTAQDDEFDDGADDFEEDEEYTDADDEEDNEYTEYDDYADSFDDEPKRGDRHSDEEWE
jgi:hypothetical protein